MKEIIVATDFSKSANRALEYAIFLANAAQSNITVVHVDDAIVHEIPGLSISGTDGREEIKKNFEELQQLYKNKLITGKLNFKFRKGKVYQEMQTQAKQSHCSLLVTGTHGESGYEEYWVGSNTYRIISHAPCATITVRSNFDITRGLKSILMPIDNTPDSLQKVAVVAEFAAIFNATVHILGLYSSKLKAVQRVVTDSAEKIKKSFSERGISFTEKYQFADNFTNLILEYAKETETDLIAVVTERGDTASNILLGQYSHQIINFAPVPVLCVHPK